MGNIYTREEEGIQVHQYGAHIFHTDDKEIWNYVNQFAEFNRCTNSPVANYKGEIYNLPFNMNTFNKLWGVVTLADTLHSRIIDHKHFEKGTQEKTVITKEGVENVVSYVELDKSLRLFASLDDNNYIQESFATDKGYRRQDEKKLYRTNGAIYLLKISMKKI